MKGFWNSQGGEHKALASVDQKVDTAVLQINLYPADSAIGFPNTFRLDRDLSRG